MSYSCTYFRNVILGIISFQFCFAFTNGISSEDSGGNNGRDGGSISTIQTIAISCGAMSGLVLCSVCTWSWWRRFWRRGDSMDVENAQYETGVGYQFRTTRGSFETLEPGNLNRPRVDFEPLPNLGDLHINQQASFEMTTLKVPTITTFTGSGNESDIHAEDWFEYSNLKSLPRVNVEYVQEIGKGWFGKVILAQVANISPFFQSVKAIVQVQREESEDREQMRFLNDARFYRDMNHDNIMKLLGHCIERTPYMLIYENWPLGDLKFYLITNSEKGETFYNNRTLFRMAIDIAKGLKYMGESGYVHGDLAARNCLVGNGNGRVIIGDYGLAPQKYKDDYFWHGQNAWPIRWAAPESLRRNVANIQATKTTTMSNVWTFGIVLWEIFEMGKTPYPELTDDEVLDKVVSVQTYVLEPPRTYLTMKTQDTLYNIMLACWNSDPESRPTMANVLASLSQP